MKRRSTPAPGEPIVIDAHGKHAQAVAFTTDGKQLVSAGQDASFDSGLFRLPGRWRVRGAPQQRQFALLLPGWYAPRNRLDGRDREALVVSAGQMSPCPCETTHGPVFSDGRHLATNSAKGRIVLWNAQAGEEVKTLPAVDERITALAFTPDAATLLVGGTGPIHRISLPEGKKVGELQGHKIVVTCLRLTPDGTLLASTGADGMLRLWSTKDWSEVRKMELRAGGMLQMAVAPKGDVVTVGADHLIQTFSLKDGKLVDRVELPVKGVYGMAISPDSCYLANAAADGKVRVWKR